MVPPIVNTQRKNILIIVVSNQTGFCVLTRDLKTSNPTAVGSTASPSFFFWLSSDSVILTASSGRGGGQFRHKIKTFIDSEFWGVMLDVLSTETTSSK